MGKRVEESHLWNVVITGPMKWISCEAWTLETLVDGSGMVFLGLKAPLRAGTRGVRHLIL
jgi:hypothetical protein